MFSKTIFSFKIALNKLILAYEWTADDKVCWKHCNKRGGKCTYCDGYCCNGKEGTYAGWNGDCPDAAIALAPLNGHRCIRRTEISTTEISTTETHTTVTTPTTTTTIPNSKLLIKENISLLK